MAVCRLRVGSQFVHVCVCVCVRVCVCVCVSPILVAILTESQGGHITCFHCLPKFFPPNVHFMQLVIVERTNQRMEGCRPLDYCSPIDPPSL